MNGEEEDRFVQVFGECSSLLPEFLAAAEEQVCNGIEVDKLRRNSSKKRKNEDVDMLSDDKEEEEPTRKQPHVDNDDAEQPTDDEDSQVPEAYYHNANAEQEVAPDLHSWRQQSNYNYT